MSSFFGSGEKTSNSFDQRVGASDSGVASQGASIIFGGAPGKNSTAFPTWIVVAGIALALGLAVWWFKKKT